MNRLKPNLEVLDALIDNCVTPEEFVESPKGTFTMVIEPEGRGLFMGGPATRLVTPQPAVFYSGHRSEQQSALCSGVLPTEDIAVSVADFMYTDFWQGMTKGDLKYVGYRYAIRSDLGYLAEVDQPLIARLLFKGYVWGELAEDVQDELLSFSSRELLELPNEPQVVIHDKPQAKPGSKADKTINELQGRLF